MGVFADERRLTDDQIATLRAWFEGGAVEGDPARLPASADMERRVGPRRT